MSGHGMPDCPDPDVCVGLPDADCMMWMLFVMTKDTCILVNDWHIKTALEWFGAVVAIVAFCLFREWVAMYRQHRHQQLIVAASRRKSNSDEKAVGLPVTSGGGAVDDNERTPLASRRRARISTWDQFVESFFYAINLTTAYILMLVVMSYNVGLISAVIGGCWFSNFVMSLYFKKYLTIVPVEGDHCCSD